MLAQVARAKPLSPLVMRGLGVGSRVRPNAFGNALGGAVVDRMSEPSAPPPISAGEKAQILGMFADGPDGTGASDRETYLSRAQEERLRSGLTMTDAGAPLGEGDYADGSDVLRLKAAKNTRSEAAISRATEQRDLRIKLDEMQKNIADLDALKAMASAESSASWPAEGGGLKVRTNFPFRDEELPEGGFFRGLVLGQSGSSVLDAHQPDWAENVGAGIHGLLLSPVNTVTGLVSEVDSQYSDMYNLLTRSRSEFTPSSALLNSLERNGIGGTLWNATESVFSAPTKPIFDLLDGRYEEVGAGLPGMIGTGLGVTRGLSGMRLGAEALPTEFIGPRLGVSGFSSTSELTGTLFIKYQGFVDDAYDAALQAEAAGRLKFPQGVPRETYLGQLVDKAARDDLRAWLSSESISEGADGVVQLNRRLYDPAGNGYRIPDVRVSGANVIFDATLGEKWLTTPQVQDFNTFTQGGRITIVRPAPLGGSYSIWP